MGLSRVQKISILLGLNAAFFVVELTVGYIIGSLALIADAYHMLSDVLGLVIALYAIKLSNRSADSKYSYGWHRAEVVAALANGMFLIALCFSIFMESLERFVHPPVIENPQLVVIVGAIGLGCNLFGIFLFREHGPDDHKKPPPITTSNTMTNQPSSIPISPVATSIHRSNSEPSMYEYPVQTRATIHQLAQDVYEMSIQGKRDDLDQEEQGIDRIVLREPNTTPNAKRIASPHQPTMSDKKGHEQSTISDGALNMRAVLIHVAGDALGCIGVIISGLIIWLTHSKHRFYVDPALSVAIAILITCSALHLVRSAAFILLQGVPPSINLSSVQAVIVDVPGVESVHELHVWQLSETKLIASVHIKVSSKRPYMEIVKDVKNGLHQCGIHSGTVQPEFADDESDTKCEFTCPPNTCSVMETCCQLPLIKEA